jgi:hypothetical protein
MKIVVLALVLALVLVLVRAVGNTRSRQGDAHTVRSPCQRRLSVLVGQCRAPANGNATERAYVCGGIGKYLCNAKGYGSKQMGIRVFRFFEDTDGRFAA